MSAETVVTDNLKIQEDSSEVSEKDTSKESSEVSESSESKETESGSGETASVSLSKEDLELLLSEIKSESSSEAPELEEAQSSNLESASLVVIEYLPKIYTMQVVLFAVLLLVIAYYFLKRNFLSFD